MPIFKTFYEIKYYVYCASYNFTSPFCSVKKNCGFFLDEKLTQNTCYSVVCKIIPRTWY